MHEIREITVAVCYMSEVIREYFGDGSKWGVNIHYQEEPRPFGTAGGVKLACGNVKETLIVMSGDGLTDFNLSALIHAHRCQGAPATIVLTQVDCPLGYGVVQLTEQSRISQFLEKPTTWTKDRPYYINTGIYILEPEILDFIPENYPFDFGHQLFPLLLKQGIPIYGVEAKGYWSDVGTLYQYYQSQLDIVCGKVRLNLPHEVIQLLSRHPVSEVPVL
jgi:NDP-sugar pyrophosphorylase family protein